MYSLKKYKEMIVYQLLGFGFVLILGAVLASMREVGSVGFLIAAVLGFLFMLLPSLYYVFLYVKTKSGLKAATRYEGKVSTWNLVFWSKSASYVVIRDGTIEYNTAAVFSRYVAPELVGKRVSYVLIGRHAVIDEVLEDDARKEDGA